VKKVEIDGVIGEDTFATNVRGRLAGVKEAELLISSPGGDVGEGLAIYNVIRDHVRDGGNITARVVGLAASMSTYIPLAANRVLVEDNAVWMIHNPRVLAAGDQNDLQQAATHLESLAATLAQAYARKSGKGEGEIRQLMNEETWFFGQEIVDAGFADAVNASDSNLDRETAVGTAEQQVSAMVGRMRGAKQFQRAAAILGTPKASAKRQKRMLSAQEKEICRHLGISENEYLAQEDRENNGAGIELQFPTTQKFTRS
jgi:ATP-dependent protease ClpP protease subunit